MIGTETLEKILTSVMFTPYIADEKPLSVLLAAEIESGKTELITKFSKNEKVRMMSDATAFSIWRDCAADIENGEIKFFVFQDLLSPFAKGSDVVNSFIMFLTNLTEEGIVEMHSGFLPEGGITMKAPTPVGVIGCIPRTELNDQRHKWARAGFMSRMLPLSWSYSEETIRKIKESITLRQYVNDPPIMLKFPTNQVKVALPPVISVEVAKLEDYLTKKMMNSTYGFRTLKQLQRIIMGLALSRGRDYVTIKDLECLTNEMMTFLNLDYNLI